MAGHKHAALMALFAADAAKMEQPWKKWQYNRQGGNSASDWADLACAPSWNVLYTYRQKPRTINVNGKELNAPIPKNATIADYPEVWGVDGDEPYKFAHGGEIACKIIKSGMAFASRADVEAFIAAVTGN